jgi:Rieske Fe-S protein
MPVTRREIVARWLQMLAAGGFLALIWKFIRGMPPGDRVVVFHRGPQRGEVVYKQGIYLVGSAEGVIAFSGRCPHLGCRLTYHRQTSRFQCPCHGSLFSARGRRLAGPARKNMSVLELQVDDTCGTYTARIPIT